MLFPWEKTPIISIIIGAVIISFSGVWVKIAEVNPSVSAFYRMLFGAFFLLIASLWSGEIRWMGRRYLLFVFLGGLFFALDLFFWHRSIIFVGPGLATILANFEVFFLTVVGILFLGEKPSLKFVFSVPMAVIGLLMIVGSKWVQIESSYIAGLYFGVAAAACYTGFILVMWKLQSNEGNTSVFFPLMSVSFISAILLGLQICTVGDTYTIPDIQSGIALVLLGLLSQAIGWIFISNALPRVRASYAGLVLLLQPALAFVWDVLLFRRETSPTNWIGVFISIAAIYMGVSGNSALKKTRNR
jgi:drug/metabolite transporter (DMT)-like permease